MTKIKNILLGRQYGWDRNYMVYRYTLAGEVTRGLVIVNPKKITQNQLRKLYVR